tara:strand:- start:213 stop:2810 length:2598 start_codon:yes stop_codon:yes gene_type:complete
MKEDFNKEVDVYTAVDDKLQFNKLPKESTEYMQDFLEELADDDGKIRAILHDETILKTLAERIYSDYNSAIRELYNNEARACRTARNKYGARPKIIVTFNVEDRQLIIEGVDSLGIDKSVFAKVLRIVGKSGNLSGTEVGQFGMGFISYALLCDLMILETWARTDDSRYALLCDVGCTFRPAPEPKMDTFGTRLSMSLKPDVEMGELINTIKNISKFSQVPTTIKIINGDVEWTKDDEDHDVNEGTYECKQYSTLAQYVRVNSDLIDYSKAGGRITDSESKKDYHSRKITWFKEIKYTDDDIDFYGFMALERYMYPDGTTKSDVPSWLNSKLSSGESHNWRDEEEEIGYLFLVGTPIKLHEGVSWGYNDVTVPLNFAINIKNERAFMPQGNRDGLERSSSERLVDKIKEITLKEIGNELNIPDVNGYNNALNKDIYSRDVFRYLDEATDVTTQQLVRTLNQRFPMKDNQYGKSLHWNLSLHNCQTIALASLRKDIMLTLQDHFQHEKNMSTTFIRVGRDDREHNRLKEWGVIIGEDYKAEHKLKNKSSRGGQVRRKTISKGDRRCIIYNGGEEMLQSSQFGSYNWKGCNSKFSSTVIDINAENLLNPHRIIQFSDKKEFEDALCSLKGLKNSGKYTIPIDVVICQSKKGLEVDTYDQMWYYIGEQYVNTMDGLKKINELDSEFYTCNLVKPKSIELLKDRYAEENYFYGEHIKKNKRQYKFIKQVIAYPHTDYTNRYYGGKTWAIESHNLLSTTNNVEAGNDYEAVFYYTKGYDENYRTFMNYKDTDKITFELKYYKETQHFTKEQREILNLVLRSNKRYGDNSVTYEKAMGKFKKVLGVEYKNFATLSDDGCEEQCLDEKVCIK